MAGRDTGVSAARLLVCVSAGVVVAFIAATVVAQDVQRAIAARASDIITNAMPSVRLLSSARGDLHLLERDIAHAGSSDAQGAAFERQAAAARQNVDEALATYSSLPFFPHERALFGHVSDALVLIDAHYATWRASPNPATLATLHSDIALADAALESVTAFDAYQGQRLGREIKQIRRSSAGLAVLVDAIAVLLAAGAVVLAVRQLQRAERARRFENAARDRREADLRDANEALGKFAAHVAHDVLSPLTTTMLSLDRVRQSCQLDEATLRATERGAAALERARALVDNLLEFARAGGKPDPDAHAELGPVLRDLCDGLSTQAQEKGIAITLAAVPAGSVACSRGVLTSIVANLIQNALKYMGDARERRIDVRVLDAGTTWHVDVSDTGPGIPDDRHERIFEPYVRGAKAGAGIGLGLATVDRLVRAHGGVLGVRSKIGAGSTFWVELPKSREATHPTEVCRMEPARRAV